MATSFEKSLSKVIADQRRLLGFSQEELAERSGLHRTYISMIERNCKNPTVKSLKLICDALNVKTYEVIKIAEEN